MPTAYPKASPTQLMGLVVLVNDHKGSEDIARLADDLDLEIDEILPSLEFAEVLGLLAVSSGRASLTDTGRKLLAGSIRERKTVLRDQLRRTTLFRTLLSALETSPNGRLTDEEVQRLIDFTSAPADALVQNIINWGRYAELFRYDANGHVLLPARGLSVSRSGGSARPPPSPPGASAVDAPASGRGRRPPVRPPEERTATAVAVAA